LVVEVTPGGAADKIGILAGDVVVRLNDKLITKSSELTSAVRQERKGTMVEIEILRDGSKLVFDVVL
jgi:S1-C subfamily serine protease